MQLYQFEVLRGEDVISVEPSVPLYNTKAAWPKIIKMAKSIKLPGCRIRVREQSGDSLRAATAGLLAVEADNSSPMVVVSCMAHEDVPF